MGPFIHRALPKETFLKQNPAEVKAGVLNYNFTGLNEKTIENRTCG